MSTGPSAMPRSTSGRSRWWRGSSRPPGFGWSVLKTSSPTGSRPSRRSVSSTARSAAPAGDSPGRAAATTSSSAGVAGSRGPTRRAPKRRRRRSSTRSARSRPSPTTRASRRRFTVPRRPRAIDSAAGCGTTESTRWAAWAPSAKHTPSTVTSDTPTPSGECCCGWQRCTRTTSRTTGTGSTTTTATCSRASSRAGSCTMPASSFSWRRPTI